MPELVADFGIILAYIIPGYITVWVISYLFKPVADLFRKVGTGENRTLAVFALTIVCLGAGMFISTIRAATLNWSFECVAVSFLCKSPHCHRIIPEDPNFGVLRCQGQRQSYLLAEANDKRPYQFYGNMALAITIAAAVLFWKMRSGSSRQRLRVLLVLAVWTVMFMTFYLGARLSYHRFVTAVKAINAVPCPAPSSSD